MIANVYATQQLAQAACDAIDKIQGYPRTYTQADVDSGLVVLGQGVRIDQVRTDHYAVPVPLLDGTYAVVAEPEVDAARVRANAIDASKIAATKNAIVVPDSAIDTAKLAAATAVVVGSSTPANLTEGD